MLLSHRLEINSTIKYDNFQLDKNYFNSDYSSDKIINIQWNNKDITKLINELKKYIANVSSKIGSYLAHIDSDTLEYVKDIYYDLALPFKLNKNEKIKSNIKLYNVIFDEILQERYNIKNIKFNCSKTTKEAILRIYNDYVKDSSKSELENGVESESENEVGSEIKDEFENEVGSESEIEFENEVGSESNSEFKSEFKDESENESKSEYKDESKDEFKDESKDEFKDNNRDYIKIKSKIKFKANSKISTRENKLLNPHSKSKILISTNISHIKDEDELINQINTILKLDNGNIEDSTKKTLERYILTYFSEKHIKTVSKIIIDLFNKVNTLGKNDSLVYKINLLNSKKIQYVIDYLTTIFENVYIIQTFTTNILKEEYLLICQHKIYETYIRDIPIVSYRYMSKNYELISNMIYFTKIYKRKLLEIFKFTDKFFLMNGYIRDYYDNFESYFKNLNKDTIYKFHLDRVFM